MNARFRDESRAGVLPTRAARVVNCVSILRPHPNLRPGSQRPQRLPGEREESIEGKLESDTPEASRHPDQNSRSPPTDCAQEGFMLDKDRPSSMKKKNSRIPLIGPTVQSHEPNG